MNVGRGRPTEVDHIKLEFAEVDADTLGAVLAGLREQSHLTQKALAKRLGVTPTTLYHWEHGISAPPVYFLFRIFEFYGYTLRLCKQQTNGVTAR